MTENGAYFVTRCHSFYYIRILGSVNAIKMQKTCVNFNSIRADSEQAIFDAKIYGCTSEQPIPPNNLNFGIPTYEFITINVKNIENIFSRFDLENEICGHFAYFRSIGGMGYSEVYLDLYLTNL